MIGGELVRIVILSYRVRKLARPLRASSAPSRNLVSLWRAAGPAALGIFVLAANPVVDRTVAARFGPGSVTILDLGEKIFYVPITIVQSSLVLVAGVRWARIGFDRRPALQRDFYRSIRLTLGLATALTALTAVALAVGPSLVAASAAYRRSVWPRCASSLPWAFPGRASG